MLKLIGRADASGLGGPVADDVWRIGLPEDAHRGRGDETLPGPSRACCGMGRSHRLGMACTSLPETILDETW